MLQDTNAHRRLTHDAVCAVGGGCARGGAVVIGSAPTPSPSVEAGHGRKAGADVCRRVRGVALQGDGQNRAKLEHQEDKKTTGQKASSLDNYTELLLVKKYYYLMIVLHCHVSYITEF